jgi:hypothetical protein
MVLQDLINELGRRLDYKVDNGRYQGVANAVGYDGIWQSTEASAIILEVKTTDAYRISLDTISGYRQKLLSAGTITGEPSILIVVGRQDTGEVEAQIRGSRHAWDIRLISAEALIKLVMLKENSDDPETGRKIRSVLTPVEYTRLDRLVDVMFTTATDIAPSIVETEVNDPGIKPSKGSAADPNDKTTVCPWLPVGWLRTAESGEPPTGSAAGSTRQVCPIASSRRLQACIFPANQSLSSGSGGWEFTDPELLQRKRDEIVEAMSRRLSVPLIKKSRALFWTADHSRRVACTISKRYIKRSSYPYWYAFHPQWDDFLEEGHDSYLILGCMDLSTAFAIPYKVIREILSGLNTTETERGEYWHIHLVQSDTLGFEILVPKRSTSLSVSEFQLNLSGTHTRMPLFDH